MTVRAVGVGYFLLADEKGSNELAAAAGVDISGFLARAIEGASVGDRKSVTIGVKVGG